MYSPREGVKSRCALTGANGYLGSRVVRRFRSGGWEVVEMARSGPSATRYSLDAPPPPEALENVDALIHCAYDFRTSTSSAFQDTNVDGSVRLLKAAREKGVKTIVFISSMAAYDGCKSHYGSGKLAVEREATKLDAVIVRPRLEIGSTHSNPQFQGSAEQQRCSIPVMLRMPAPPELQRWAALDEPR